MRLDRFSIKYQRVISHRRNGSIDQNNPGLGHHSPPVVWKSSPLLNILEEKLTFCRRVYGAGLHTSAVAKGKLYFGSATDNPELTDAAYLTQLSNTDDFGQITPGNAQKVRKTLALFSRPIN